MEKILIEALIEMVKRCQDPPHEEMVAGGPPLYNLICDAVESDSGLYVIAVQIIRDIPYMYPLNEVESLYLCRSVSADGSMTFTIKDSDGHYPETVKVLEQILREKGLL